MQSDVFVANESLQELRALREGIEELQILGNGRNKYIQQLIALESKEELEKVEIQQLRLIFSIKLQKLMMALSQLQKCSRSTITATYDKIIEIEEANEGKLRFNEKVISLKIIQAVLDYKISQKYGIQGCFKFDDLLPIIEEHHLFERIYARKDQEEYKLFFLGLMGQYLQKRAFENYLEICGLTINYLKEKIEKMKKEAKSTLNEAIIKQLIVLLNVHLTCKLLKKHLKFQQQNIDQNVYVLLYDLDYSLNQRLTIEYKKYYNKTLEQALTFSIDRLKSFVIDSTANFIFENDLLMTKKVVKPSQFRIKKSSSQGEFKRRLSLQKYKSLKKEDRLKVVVKNEMFIPEKINYNKKLQHKIQFKRDKKLKIEGSNKKISIQNIQHAEKRQVKHNEHSIQIQYTYSKDQIDTRYKILPPKTEEKQEDKITYQNCLKSIVTRSEGLQLMLCQRPTNNFNHLDIYPQKNPAKQEDERLIISNRKKTKSRANTSKRISQNYSSIKMMQQRVEASYSSDRKNISLYVPPSIKKIFCKYMLTFWRYANYQKIKKQTPFFGELVSLDPKKYYFLFSNIYRFLQVGQENLVFRLKYLLNGRYLKQILIDLKQATTASTIQAQLSYKPSKQAIYQMFYLGKEIHLFKLNLKLPLNQSPFLKHQITTIRYQYQIYAYSVYLNCCTLTSRLTTKILKMQQGLIRGINQQVEIDYQYNLPDDTRELKYEKLTDSSSLKFHQFFSQRFGRYDHSLILQEHIRMSLKYKKGFTIFQLILYRCADKKKCYLMIEDGQYFKSIISCRTITSISLLFKSLRSVNDLKKTIIQQNLLFYSCWNDVLLNRTVLQPSSIQYCIRNGGNYRIYHSRTLLDNQLKFIYGPEKDKKWLFLASMLDIQPTWLKNLPSRDRKIKTSKNVARKMSRRDIKGQEMMGTEMWLAEHIKAINITEQHIHFNREVFKPFYFQYDWIYYQREKVHTCFKLAQFILDFTIFRKELLYIHRFPVNKHELGKPCKEQIFKQYRNQLTEHYNIFNMPFFEFSQIVRIKCQQNNFLCLFQHQQREEQLVIPLSQLSDFLSQTLPITSKLLHRPLFKRRLLHLLKQKIHQLNYDQY